jgi:hypothetical protein
MSLIHGLVRVCSALCLLAPSVFAAEAVQHVDAEACKQCN